MKNFDQLAAGDVIDVIYTEHLTVRVGTAGCDVDVGRGRFDDRQPWREAGRDVRERTETKATITAIDKARGVAVLTVQDGGTF